MKNSQKIHPSHLSQSALPSSALLKSRGDPSTSGTGSQRGCTLPTHARGLLNDKEAEGTRSHPTADPPYWHRRAGAEPCQQAGLGPGTAARGEDALPCCCLSKPGFLSVTAAGTLPCRVPWRGQRGLSWLSQPSRAHVERGVAAAGPRGVPAAGRAGCRCLVTNRIRARGGSQGGLLTLASCFSA